MRTTKFFVAAMAALTIFSACKDEKNDALVGISLDKTTATVVEGETTTLTATLNPTSSNAAITWESANTAVATVANGVVTAVKAGTAMIAATAEGKTATCLVTVTAKGSGDGGNGGGDGSLPASLKGSKYFPIILDAVSFAKIENKVVADLRVDDTNNFLYVWEGTMIAGETSGLNFYGEAEGWVSLTVGTVGWSGWGQNIQDLARVAKLSEIMADPKSYYFHMAIKSTSAKMAHGFQVNGTAGTGWVPVGGAFVDNGASHSMLADYNNDGSWNEIEIPMDKIIDQGVVFSANPADAINIFVGLHGGVSGTNMQMDAVFIYKK